MPEIIACHPDMATFWRLLAKGFCTGQPLLPLLRSVADTLPPEPMGSVAAALARDVDANKQLSEAMRNHPTIFGKAHINLVEAGEYLGRLDRILMLILEFTWTCPTCGHLQFPAVSTRQSLTSA